MIAPLTLVEVQRVVGILEDAAEKIAFLDR
jgi:hypothetical protein